MQIDRAHYVCRPWKNGLGESLEVAAEHDPDFTGSGAADGWDSLVWSLSFTSFSAPTRFSDMNGFDRLLTLMSGRALALRALDGARDLVVPLGGVIEFGGGRLLEGLPDGTAKVMNLIGRRRRVRMGLEWLGEESPRRLLVADVVLVSALLGESRFAGISISDEATLRLDKARINTRVEGSTVLVATIDRTGG